MPSSVITVCSTFEICSVRDYTNLWNGVNCNLKWNQNGIFNSKDLDLSTNANYLYKSKIFGAILK